MIEADDPLIALLVIDSLIAGMNGIGPIHAIIPFPNPQ